MRKDKRKIPDNGAFTHFFNEMKAFGIVGAVVCIIFLSLWDNCITAFLPNLSYGSGK